MSSLPTPPRPSSQTPKQKPAPPILAASVELALKPLTSNRPPAPQQPQHPQQQQQQPQQQQPQFDKAAQHAYERTFVKLINCDHNFCPDIPGLYFDLLHHGAQLFYPAEFAKFSQCQQALERRVVEEGRQREAGPNPHEEDCLPLFTPITEQLLPIIEQHLQFRRQRYSPDPLESYYDNFKYDDPMWFAPGALNIWRRKDGGSKTVKVGDCEQFVHEYDQCMTINGNNYQHCFKEHFNSSICEPGFNCPSLQPQILRCTTQVDGRQDSLEACFKQIPKFLPCALGEHVEEEVFRQPSVQPAAI